jgi:hypothetical protein
MIISLLVMVLFMVFVLPAEAESARIRSGGAESPDTSFFYNPEELGQWAEEYGENGRRAYIQSRWTFDLVFPLVYTAFLTFGISWLSLRVAAPESKFMLLNLIALSAGAMDILENSGTSLVMGFYPAKSIAISYLTAGFSGLKWIFLFASFLVYFLLWGIYLIQKIQRIRK